MLIDIIASPSVWQISNNVVESKNYSFAQLKVVTMFEVRVSNKEILCEINCWQYFLEEE